MIPTHERDQKLKTQVRRRTIKSMEVTLSKLGLLTHYVLHHSGILPDTSSLQKYQIFSLKFRWTFLESPISCLQLRHIWFAYL